jgi:hypothetical protein
MRVGASSYVVLLVFALIASPAPGVPDALGSDSVRSAAALLSHAPAPSGDCDILWFGLDIANEVSRYRGLGFDIVHTEDPAEVNLANLADFDVLTLSVTGPGVLGGVQADIEAFVNEGHGLHVHQPNAVGALDYMPADFDISIADYWFCDQQYVSATIVDSTHPVTTGLADADLSGDGDLVGSIGSGFQLLAENVVCGDPALAAGTSGAGRVVFETGNGGDNSVLPGSDAYWTRLFTWLCEAEPFLPVDIDVKPRSDRNRVNPLGRGFIPVAILGSDSFDVAQVDVTTLAFGPDGAEPAFDLTSPGSCRPSRRDVNDDGYTDLVSSYRIEETGIALGSTEACLTGSTLDGALFRGCDEITTAPGCGLGVELALFLSPLLWLRRRRSRR